MYGQPIRVQQFQGGFSGSRFQSMGRREGPDGAMGAVLVPSAIPVSPFVRVSPPVVVAPPAFVPPTVIAPPGVYYTDPSADDNKAVGIIAAVGLLVLGAALL
jgi:hypothetical protein